MLKRVLIANRGEIALRVRRACREAGIETVSVYSQADAEALHVQLATRSVCIGPPRAADSYLNPQALLSAAIATGCDGLHPGYGFLSENPEFADACAENGITFIGPSGDAIRKAGSKSAARDLMRAAGVPVTPGSDGPVSSVEDALAVAETVGYPVLLKASAGGGGRGIRRCDSSKDLPDAYAAAKAEANACFGNDEMYLEKLVLEPRHIEFQILADRQGHVIHLGDRDCSIQRRNQKLIEEAPARCLTPELREEMGRAAVKAAQAVRYEGAGTVEFLLDSDGQHFYFMEMNTRIQVEHGITEMITGVDLVRQQLRIASGLPLDLTQEDVTLTGFYDDEAIPTWAKAYAAAGVADGIIQGVSTAEGVAFQGDEPITFNEAATVLNRVLAVEDVDLAGWYADREAVPSWAAQAVGNMEAVSVLAAGSFGSAAMGENVTRADAAQMLSAAGTLLEGEPAGLFDWLL